MQFNDKDMVLDLLFGTKYVSTAYHHGVLEAANDRVRNTFIQLNNEELALQKQLFNLAHERGWYQVEQARSTTTQMPATTGMAGTGQQMASTSQQLSPNLQMNPNQTSSSTLYRVPMPEQMGVRENFYINNNQRQY